MKKVIRLTENDLNKIIVESVNNLISENDRHRPGYWKERWAKEKAARQEANKQDDSQSNNQKKPKKDRHRKGYYREYNKKHPERLNRGYTKGHVNGCVSSGDDDIIGFDELGRPVTNDPFSDLLRNKEMEWHDDDWFEGINDDY